jgi:proteasome alpha subunit
MHWLVGFQLSPALKKAFGDPMTIPLVARALFAEIGRGPEGSQFYILNYDGEFKQQSGAAVIAGTQTAEDRMMERIGEPNPNWTREEALQKALLAWSVGAREALRQTRHAANEEDDLPNPLRDIEEAEADAVFLRDELKTGTVEVGLLERRPNRDSCFRLLPSNELETLTASYR